MTLLIFAVSPIPFWPVRILSISTRYPFGRYTTAVTIGRIPRYFLLAFGGMTLNIPDWLIAVIFIAMITLPLILKLMGIVRKRLGSARGTASDKDEQPATLNL